jgi:hypothetical protein
MEPSARGVRCARARLALLTAALGLLALPATAAQVLQVRIGEHPEFTRVVFELDSRAGYRVERKAGAQGTELLVTLDASSATRKITRRGSDVPLVEVTAGEHAVARIRLRKGDLALKEMILSKPYRVVLDVMRETPVATAKAAPAPPKPVAKVEPKPEPKPAPKAAPAPEPAPAPPKPVAKVEPKPEPKAAPAPEPAPAPPKPEAKAVPAPAPAPAVPPAEKPLMTADDLAKLVAGKSAAPPTPGAEKPAEAAPAPPAETKVPSPVLPSPPPAVAKVEKPAEAPQKPAATRTPAEEQARKGGASWLSNPLLLAGAGGVLVCALALFFVLRRRRALPNDLDVTAIAEEHAEAAGSGDAGTTTAQEQDESSFAGLFDDEETPRAAVPPSSASTPRPAPAPKGTPLDSLFDDDDAHGPPVRQGAAKMTPTTPTDLPMDRAGAGAARPATPPAARGPAPAGGPAAGGDVMRLVQELERRMGALEAKLEQANEAREKLERQVAAQSEELRVQRAAIARTQRALRTMSRGDEEKATEPALREETATKVRPGGL